MEIQMMPLENRVAMDKNFGGILLNTDTFRESPRLSMKLLRSASQEAAYMATHTRAVAVCFLNPLNEYLVFKKDPLQRKRTQDHIKAYTWHDYMERGAKEPERIMEMPVMKAIVRGMDAVSDFIAQQKDIKATRPTRFGIFGYSKNGMGTWMAGAVDPRVEAIAPMNNMMTVNGGSLEFWRLKERSMQTGESLLDLYRKTEDKLSLLQQPGNPDDPYTNNHILDFMFKYQTQKLLTIIDPTGYFDKLERLDKFYLHDDKDNWFEDQGPYIQEWWPDLPGKKHLLIVDATHQTTEKNALAHIAAFFDAHIRGVEMPEIEWDFGDNQTFMVRQVSNHVPISMNLWSAEPCNKKQFQESKWKAVPVGSHFPDAAPRSFKEGRVTWSHIQPPKAGCMKAFFVDAEYSGADGDNFKISTPIYKIPKGTPQYILAPRTGGYSSGIFGTFVNETKYA